MQNSSQFIDNLHNILSRYKLKFNQKAYSNENDEHDILMDIFSITPEMKRENRQYWGRELGMCWQLLIIEVCKHLRNFKPAMRFGSDEPYDLLVGHHAIDTKYRIGSD